jgi:hypothetical protein
MGQQAKTPTQSVKPTPMSGFPFFFNRSSQINLYARDTSIQYPYPIRAWGRATDNVYVGLRFSRSLSVGF